MRFSFAVIIIFHIHGTIVKSSGRGNGGVRTGGSVPLPSDAIPGEEADGWKLVETALQHTPGLTHQTIES